MNRENTEEEDAGFLALERAHDQLEYAHDLTDNDEVKGAIEEVRVPIKALIERLRVVLSKPQERMH